MEVMGIRALDWTSLFSPVETTWNTLQIHINTLAPSYTSHTIDTIYQLINWVYRRICHDLQKLSNNFSGNTVFQIELKNSRWTDWMNEVFWSVLNFIIIAIRLMLLSTQIVIIWRPCKIYGANSTGKYLKTMKHHVKYLDCPVITTRHIFTNQIKF